MDVRVRELKPHGQSWWNTSSILAHHSPGARFGSGSLHGLHDGPPAPGLEVRGHEPHVGLEVVPQYSKYEKRPAVPVEDG